MAASVASPAQLREYYASYFPFRELCDYFTERCGVREGVSGQTDGGDANDEKAAAGSAAGLTAAEVEAKLPRYALPAAAAGAAAAPSTPSSSRLVPREFALIYATATGEAWKRYNSFAHPDALRAKCAVPSPPIRIDVGCEFNGDPQRLQGSHRLFPVRRELVFDIDMDDYDALRTCCAGKQVCCKCFVLLRAGARALAGALREQFGLHHLVFVFSGGRGLHIWVADERARAWSDETRSGVARRLCSPRAVSSAEDVPSVLPAWWTRAARALSVDVMCAGEGLVDQQRFLEMQPAEEQAAAANDGAPPASFHARVAKALQLLTPEQRAVLEEQIAAGRSTREIFESVQRQSGEAMLRQERSKQEAREAFAEGAGALPRVANHEELRDSELFARLVLGVAYPFLDEKVSTKMNHLLKAPFCVHPRSGNVCVVLDGLEGVEKFLVDECPKVADVVKSKGEVLAPYVKNFRKAISQMASM